MKFIKDNFDLRDFYKWCEDKSVLAIDCETSGLNPRKDYIRLLTISNDVETWIIDDMPDLVKCIIPTLQTKTLIGHNLLFDMSFLWQFGLYSTMPLIDTMLMSQLVYAGLRDDNNKPLSHSLDACVKRELKIDLDKTLQKSDWNGQLTQEQYNYAARDVEVLMPLHESLFRKINFFKLNTVCEIEMRALPAIIYMSCAGVPINYAKWCKLADEEQTNAEKLKDDLNAVATFEGIQNLVNWNSPVQVKSTFEKCGIKLYDTKFETISQVNHPLAKLLTNYRETTKRLTTYGRNWEQYIENGRIHPSWGQCFTVAGRMSCSAPNCQNLPRDKRYRACIEAPAGHTLVIADYGMIEVRIAARLANETRMIEAFKRGDDIHSLTAGIILEKSVEQITKAERQIGKSCVFALVYGAGAEKLRRYAQSQFGVSISKEEAIEYKKRFMTAYPGLQKWHRSVGQDPVNTRTLAGRHRIQVDKFTERLNSPSQGSGSDMIKLALGLLWERRNECSASFPILAVHDELVLQSPDYEAEKAKQWLIKAMLDASEWMLYPVPVETSSTICQDWSEK